MSEILKAASEVLHIEAQGLLDLKERLDDNFERVVELILASPGKVVTTGIGKSGIVGRKIVATLRSTGTNAVFLHPVEALHGDLGMVNPGDVVLALSNSGRSEELVHLVPDLRSHGAKVVALTGGLDSPLAQAADLVLDCGVPQEACPLGLAPTASTTAVMAMGDALAVVLMQKRRFKAEDFRHHHPGGKLGDRLMLPVNQVMVSGAALPLIDPQASAAAAVAEMDRGDLGHVLISQDGRLLGIFSDGDIRRAVLAGVDLSATAVEDIMTRTPRTIGPQALGIEALAIMEEREITALPVLDQEGRLEGIIHLHDLLGRGKVSFNGLAGNE